MTCCTDSPIFAIASAKHDLIDVFPLPGGPTTATPVLLFNRSFSWTHLLAISFVNPRVSQIFNNATIKFSLSAETGKEELLFGKRSSSNAKNFVVSVSVSFGRVDALIEMRSLPENDKNFFNRPNFINEKILKSQNTYDFNTK